MASRPEFCPHCGEKVQYATNRYCTKCGGDLVQVDLAEAKEPEPVATPPVVAKPPPPAPVSGGSSLGDRLQQLWNEASGPTQCTGCRRTSGPPGALCPHCGSRYPSPRAGLIGIGVAAFGGLCLLIAYASTGGLFESNKFHHSPFEGIGAVALVIGVGMFIYSVGRAGPERQSSCCGCSCAVLLFVLPAGALYLGLQGGPASAALIVPVAIPLTWALDAGMVFAWLTYGTLRELVATATPTRG